uniref:GCV_T domain-containing protein n=1 Tax=Macrostomum lignano TaxID=282301 RepID=A0A1I8FB73_9PLAT
MARVTSHIVKEVNGGLYLWEINQNGADVGHLTTVHDPSFFGGHRFALHLPLVEQLSVAEVLSHLKPCTSREAGTRLSWCCTEKTYLFGKNVKFVEMTVRANQLGPAVVYWSSTAYSAKAYSCTA